MRFLVIPVFLLLLVASPVAATPLMITNGVLVYDSSTGFANVTWGANLTVQRIVREPGPDLFCQRCNAGGVVRSSELLSFGDAPGTPDGFHDVHADLTATWQIPRSSGEIAAPFQLSGTLTRTTETEVLLGHGVASTLFLYDPVTDTSFHRAVTYTFTNGLSADLGGGSPVPEAATGLLLGAGLLALLLWKRRPWRQGREVLA
jgi:PEP-CTERM motif-containing protein